MNHDPLSALKSRVLSNRFSYRLRRDGVIDEAELADLLAAWEALAAIWRDQSTVDKALAGSITSTLLIAGGAHERFARSGADEHAHRMALVLGELYSRADACFDFGDMD